MKALRIAFIAMLAIPALVLLGQDNAKTFDVKPLIGKSLAQFDATLGKPVKSFMGKDFGWHEYQHTGFKSITANVEGAPDKDSVVTRIGFKFAAKSPVKDWKTAFAAVGLSTKDIRPKYDPSYQKDPDGKTPDIPGVIVYHVEGLKLGDKPGVAIFVPSKHWLSIELSGNWGDSPPGYQPPGAHK